MSDIVGRLGGDESCALVIDANEQSTELVQRRLMERLDARNAIPGQRFPLSFSVGVLWCEPGDERPLEGLLADVDARMYQHKGARRSLRQSGRQ